LKRFNLLALSCLLTFGATGPGLAADCEVPTIQTADNQTVDGKMTVKTGKSCSVGMGTGAAGIVDPEVTKRPKNGSAELRGFRVFYTPKKGFVGNDEFTYIRYQMDRWGNKAMRGVNMKVEVLP
jgi:hypothetical protein